MYTKHYFCHEKAYIFALDFKLNMYNVCMRNLVNKILLMGCFTNCGSLKGMPAEALKRVAFQYPTSKCIGACVQELHQIVGMDANIKYANGALNILRGLDQIYSLQLCKSREKFAVLTKIQRASTLLPIISMKCAKYFADQFIQSNIKPIDPKNHKNDIIDHEQQNLFLIHNILQDVKHKQIGLYAYVSDSDDLTTHMETELNKMQQDIMDTRWKRYTENEALMKSRSKESTEIPQIITNMEERINNICEYTQCVSNITNLRAGKFDTIPKEILVHFQMRNDAQLNEMYDGISKAAYQSFELLRKDFAKLQQIIEQGQQYQGAASCAHLIVITGRLSNFINKLSGEIADGASKKASEFASTCEESFLKYAQQIIFAYVDQKLYSNIFKTKNKNQVSDRAQTLQIIKSNNKEQILQTTKSIRDIGAIKILSDKKFGKFYRNLPVKLKDEIARCLNKDLEMYEDETRHHTASMRSAS